MEERNVVDILVPSLPFLVPGCPPLSHVEPIDLKGLEDRTEVLVVEQVVQILRNDG